MSVIAFLSVFVIGSSVAAWQINEQHHNNRVASATTIAGINVSGKNEAALHVTLLALQQRVQAESIDIGHDKQRFSTPTTAFDLALDIDATQQAAMHFNHTTAAPKRFARWVTGHFHKNAAPVIVKFNNEKLAAVISNSDPGPRTQPTNPSIAYENGSFVAVKGNDGEGLINADAPEAVRTAVHNGFPLQAHIETGNIPAISGTADVQTILKDADTATKDPLTVSAGEKTGTLSAEALRPLMRATASGDHLQLDVDTALTVKALQKVLTDAGTKPVEAGYTVVDNTPHIVDGKPGSTCCSDAAASIVRDALASRLTGGDIPAVDLPLAPVQPKTTTASVPDLGIKEMIGTFTTHHPAGQPRVTNIHLISDLTRGSIIKPGETFSINNAVGKRTKEKGFVVDHVIDDGKFSEDVGGGISQYATTLFNAAFFAGLDFGEYQSHSLYIDRYPYGREATVSFPHPDMQIKNTTPYGVLIWPTYTDTSLTLTLYSTKYATGAQTSQTTQPSGKCTRVRTERTRTYVDGHTSIDSVSALYQPKEGERC